MSGPASPSGDWTFPTGIRLGAGRISELGDACAQAGIGRPLLVTDRNLAGQGIAARARELLGEAGLGDAMFAEVDSDPDEISLAAGIEAYLAGGHDGVIAFGGGSGLDLGKLVAFMAGQELPVWEFEDIGERWRRADAHAIAPVVAVPTTAGTGSEVGRAGILTDSRSRVKKIIFHPGMMPKAAICDPELTVGMPGRITAGTGMDALAHCVEAYCTPVYHPLCQGIALEGMRLVREFLPRAHADGGDLEARAHMMSAAMMGSTSFQKGLGAIHALSHPLGLHFRIHHGTANAVVMPAVLRFNRGAIEARIERAADYLGIGGGFDGFVGFVEELNATLGIPAGLEGLGVARPDDAMLERIVAEALADPCSATNPVRMDEANTKDLLASCFEG